MQIPMLLCSKPKDVSVRPLESSKPLRLIGDLTPIMLKFLDAADQISVFRVDKTYSREVFMYKFKAVRLKADWEGARELICDSVIKIDREAGWKMYNSMPQVFEKTCCLASIAIFYIDKDLVKAKTLMDTLNHILLESYVLTYLVQHSLKQKKVDEAVEYAIRIKDPQEKSRAFYLLVIHFLNLGDVVSGMKYISEILDINDIDNLVRHLVKNNTPQLVMTGIQNQLKKEAREPFSSALFFHQRHREYLT